MDWERAQGILEIGSGKSGENTAEKWRMGEVERERLWNALGWGPYEELSATIPSLSFHLVRRHWLFCQSPGQIEWWRAEEGRACQHPALIQTSLENWGSEMNSWIYKGTSQITGSHSQILKSFHKLMDFMTSLLTQNKVRLIYEHKPQGTEMFISHTIFSWKCR